MPAADDQLELESPAGVTESVAAVLQSVTPDPRRVMLRDIGHCGRTGCRCTHTEGCEFGWVDMPAYTDPVTKQTYAPVSPCPVCRPEHYARLRADSSNDGQRVGRRRT